MSRTKHHSLRHGTVKGGTGDKRRACGYDYWGRRPGGTSGPDIGRERAIAKESDMEEFYKALDAAGAEWVPWKDVRAD